MKRVLVVAAHPDDEVLGCGGTMAALAQAGHEVYVLILGEGVTSRDEIRDPLARAKEIEALRQAARKAAQILGAKEVFFEDLPDNRFDTVPFLEIVKKIERIKTKVRPEIIFTHYEGDLNIDHQITARAVMTATRPLPGETVNSIYSFEVLSSTEWNFFTNFKPNVYVDISKNFSQKIEAFNCYTLENRLFPYPRSEKVLASKATVRGSEAGFKFAEAFNLIRENKKLENGQIPF